MKNMFNFEGFVYMVSRNGKLTPVSQNEAKITLIGMLDDEGHDTTYTVEGQTLASNVWNSLHRGKSCYYKVNGVILDVLVQL